MPRVHWLAYGTVQGVGFRAWIRNAARRLELCGRVWNRSDGTVEIEAVGDRDSLDRLHAQIAAGPPLARVTRVEDLPPGYEELPCPFEITY